MLTTEESVRTETKPLIALVGAPNSGKTTLYNWLTNSRFRTVNYPGATVEYCIGNLASQWNEDMEIMDTPGTYSLFPKSADEEVTLKVLYDLKSRPVDKVILVCDGTQLDRHLLLALQLREAGFATLVALTMADILRKSNSHFNKTEIENFIGCPVVMIDGMLGSGIKELISTLKTLDKSKPLKITQWTEGHIGNQARGLKSVIEKSLDPQGVNSFLKVTERLDRILLHPIFGLALFLLIMGSLFTSIFWLAAPLMDLIDTGFSDLGAFLESVLAPTLARDFLVNGIVASFAAVLVFVPQILILFLGVGFLESTGYLARAATLVDKPLSKLGLSGRSFVPLLSGFACAVPAMMATRNISSSKERFIANMVIPLLTCSARLPVYALLLSFLFLGQAAWKAGFALAGLYFGAILLAGLASAVLAKLLPNSSQSHFLMELPLYRRPRLKILVRQALTRTKAYVYKAGPIIFVFAALIWAGMTFPNYKEENKTLQLQQSYLGKIGQVIEPVFEPMGADWRVGVGLLSAFAAREVFVSSMAIVFNIADADEESQTDSLLNTMREAQRADGSLLFTGASVAALIVFFMIALQCMSTVAISAKENGSSKVALGQLLALNLLAYLLAVAVYQVGQIF